MFQRLCVSTGVLLTAILTVGSASLVQAREQCQEQPGTSGYFEKTIDSGGWLRHYILYVPPKYNAHLETPLVFNFHGLGWDADDHFTYTEMDRMADKFKFILVTPIGFGRSWNAGDCCFPASAFGIDDVGFTSDMIDRISEEYCIDDTRIYAMGFSNGGFMSWRLACQLSDRIAAIAPVAGAILGGFPCLPTRTVSVIALHGTDDVLVPYSGGPPPWGDWGGLPSASVWANGMCTDTREVVYAEGDVTCHARTECADHGRVEFCTVEGGGHNWPGAIDLCAVDPSSCPVRGYTTQDIDASRAIAKFFKKYPARGQGTD